MPFSEFLRMAKGKVDPMYQKTPPFSTDPSSGTDNEFFELVWENGQVMMQGQSSRARKGPIPDNSPPLVSKPRDGKDANTSKMAKFGTVDPPVSDFQTSPPPSCEMGFNQDEDIVPWLNYTVADPLSNECCSDLLPGLSGVTVNGLSTADNLTLTEKKNNYSHMMTDDHLKSATNALSSRQGSVSKATFSAGDTRRSRNGDRPHLMQNKDHASGSGMCDSTRSNVGNTSQLNGRNSVQCLSQMDGSTSLDLHNKHEGQPRNDSNFMNFSYFSRLASSPGVNNRNSVSSTPGALSCSTHILGNDDKGAPIISGHPLESIRLDPNIRCSRQESNSHAHATLPQQNIGVESRDPDRCRDSFPPRQSGAVCLEDDSKNDKSSNQASCPAIAGAVVGGEKIIEPVVAASSLGSCNSLERGSNNPNSYLKRKASETVESESPTEEVEEGSVGVRQTSVPRTRTKRSRAAEVHNLSERRRRDRINEKMRSLQELIPNCNKADKASMLDEAIEYLKTLQLQVQMLSMGAGMYIPPMMVPPAMQHIHRSQMPHFTPMAMNGMGMGLAFGMGIHELNNSMMQRPPMSGPCYPLPGFPQISSSSTFPGLAGSCNQGFGYPSPGQIPMPHLPLPLGDTAGLKLRTGNVPTMHGAANDPPVAPSTISTDMVQNIGTEVMHNANNAAANNATGPTKQDSAQVIALLNDPPQDDDADDAQNLAGDSNTKPN